jgi:hypothetical protein
LMKVEVLDAQKPGLRQYVDLRLDAGASGDAIASEVKTKYGFDIPPSTLRAYRVGRWLPSKLRVQSQIERMKAIMAQVEEYGVSNYTRAYIIEKLSESDKPPPSSTLLHEQRERERLELGREKLRLDAQKVKDAKKAVQLKFRELKANRDKVRKLVKGAGRGQENAQQALKHIREIYGLGR